MQENSWFRDISRSLRKEYVQQLRKGHPGADAAMERTRDVVYSPL